MTTLQELLATKNDIIETIIQASGEVEDSMELELANIEQNLIKKVDALDYVLNGLEAEAKTLKEQADRYSNAARALKTAATRLKSYVKENMHKQGQTTLEGDSVRFTLASGRASLEINPDLLPKEYFMQVVELVPDKKKIEEAIGAGIEIPGARFNKTLTLRSSIKKGDAR